MAPPAVRCAAVGFFVVAALSLSPREARADEPAETWTRESVADYEQAIAEEELLLRSARGAKRESINAHLAQLRANYDRDVHAYSPATTVAGVVLVVLGTGGAVFGFVGDATSPSSDYQGLGTLVFAVPSLLGGVVPGVILIGVGSKSVFSRPPASPGATVSVSAGGLSGTF